MNIRLLRHCCSCGVVAYKFLKEFHYPEDICQKGYFLGYIHDCMKPLERRDLRDHMMLLSGMVSEELLFYVINHEVLLQSNEDYPILYIALKFADHTVDSNGDFVGFDGRLIDVANRYGADSVQYQDMLNDIAWLREREYDVVEKKFLDYLDIIYNNIPENIN